MWIFLDDDPYRPVIGPQCYGLIAIVYDALHRSVTASTMYAKLAFGNFADDPTIDCERIKATAGSQTGPKRDVAFGRGHVDGFIQRLARHDVDIASSRFDVDGSRDLAQINIAQSGIDSNAIDVGCIHGHMQSLKARLGIQGRGTDSYDSSSVFLDRFDGPVDVLQGCLCVTHPVEGMGRLWFDQHAGIARCIACGTNGDITREGDDIH